MNTARTRASASKPLTQIKLFCPAVVAEPHIAFWRVDGFPLRVTIWTESEWSNLIDPPRDAQHLGCGVWCALAFE